jgi:hypothetical protein
MGLSVTKAERDYQDQVRDLGCILCLLTLRMRNDCDIHHRLSGGRHMGERFVLGLCPSHHRGGLGGKVSKNNPLGIMSRGQSQRRFEAHYGMTEAEMQAKQDELIEGKKCLYVRLAA